MGLFSDKCTAIVSIETGRHLTGDELAEAKAVLRNETGLFHSSRKVLEAHGWRICGHNVKKKARFCSKCGAPAPKGWTKCPSCGKWVGNEMTHCWNCDHPLHPETRTNLAGGVWNRAEGLFAERFEIGEIENMLKNGIQVQEGSAAILLDAGKEKTVIGPGRHDPASLARAINWFGNPPPRSAVLVDAGEFIVPLRMSENLRTADGFPISVYAELTLQFVRGRADDFLRNFMKDARTVSYEEMGESLSSVLIYGIQNLCNTSTVEDLVKDPARRDQFEAALRKAADETMKAWGLEVVRVGAADFDSAEYAKVRAANEGLDARRREIEFLQKAREIAAAEREVAAGAKMDEAKEAKDQAAYMAGLEAEETVADAERKASVSGDLEGIEARRRRESAERETALAERLAELAQEKEVSDIERDAALKLLLLEKRNEISSREADYELARRVADRAAAMEAELKDTDHDIALKEKLRAYTVEAMLKDELGQEELLKIQAREEEIRSRIETSKIDLEAYRTRTSATAEADANAYRTRTEGIAQTDVEADRILRVGKATNEVRSGEVDNDLKRLKGLRDIDRDIDETKIRASDAEAARLKDLSTEALVVLADDAEKVRALAEIERVRAQRGMTHEQILAQAAAQSPEAAQALGTMATANIMGERERAVYDARVRETREDRDAMLKQDLHYGDTLGEVSKLAINHGEKTTFMQAQNWPAGAGGAPVGGTVGVVPGNQFYGMGGGQGAGFAAGTPVPGVLPGVAQGTPSPSSTGTAQGTPSSTGTAPNQGAPTPNS